jgi:hypothetical protein
MTVVAKVGEHTMTASVHVWLIPCPVGDPVADNTDVRMQWIAQQDSTAPESKERGGVVLRNLTTGTDSVINLPGVSKATCWVSWPPQFAMITGFPTQLLANYKIIAFWHTHWVPPNYSCTDSQGNPYTAGSGLSNPDWNSSRVLNCPMYTIDQNRIWRVDPTWDQSKYSNRYPQREVRRDPHTKKCPAIAPWAATGSLPGEEAPPYTC